MSQENVEIARQLMAAWSRRDLDGAIELLHEDIEWHPALTAGGLEGVVYRGLGGIRRWFGELDDVWAELRIELEEFREVGEDRILQLGHFHAVGKESGVPIDQPQAILLAMEDGRVIAGWGFASHEEALETAGLSEQVMSQENVQLTRRAYEALNRRDLDAFLAATDPDVVAVPRIVAIEGGALRGHDGIRRWWDSILSAFPDFDAEVISVRGFDDFTIASVRVTGHGQGSGAPFEDAIWVASRVRGGKVVWWQTCESEAEALETVGISE